jgi:hypothetical protein
MSLSKSLKMDLPALAEMLRSKGRKGDAILAHISPKEAALLKRKGGAGTTNPETGLPEFYGEDGGDFTPVQTETGAPITNFQAPATTPADNSGGGGDGGYTLNYGKAPVSTAIPTTDASGQSYNYYPGAEQQSYATPGLSAATQYGIQPAVPSLTSQTQPFGQIAGTQAPTTPTDTTQQKPDFGTRLTNALTDPANLAKLGLAGGLGLFGASQARKAAAQGQVAQGQEQAIAQPYQSQGQQLIAQAQAGQLNPTSQAALQAARAQSSQSIANRGGVGTEAEANRIATLTQQLLNNQYQYGLQVMQIGDNISLGAIKTGLQLDTQLNTATNNFYTQLAQMVGSNFTPSTVVRTTGTTNG